MSVLNLRSGAGLSVVSMGREAANTETLAGVLLGDPVDMGESLGFAKKAHRDCSMKKQTFFNC